MNWLPLISETLRACAGSGAFVGYHIGLLLALGGTIVTSIIAAAVGAAVVLFGCRMAKGQ